MNPDGGASRFPLSRPVRDIFGPRTDRERGGKVAAVGGITSTLCFPPGTAARPGRAATTGVGATGCSRRLPRLVDSRRVRERGRQDRGDHARSLGTLTNRLPDGTRGVKREQRLDAPPPDQGSQKYRWLVIAALALLAGIAFALIRDSEPEATPTTARSTTTQVTPSTTTTTATPKAQRPPFDVLYRPPTFVLRGKEVVITFDIVCPLKGPPKAGHCTPTSTLYVRRSGERHYDASRWRRDARLSRSSPRAIPPAPASTTTSRSPTNAATQ